MIIAFFWIFLSILLIVKNLNFLEKFLHFFVLIMAGTILCKDILKTTKFDKIIIVYAISFLLSSFFIIIDLSVVGVFALKLLIRGALYSQMLNLVRMK